MVLVLRMQAMVPALCTNMRNLRSYTKGGSMTDQQYVFATKTYPTKQAALKQYQQWIDDDVLRDGTFLLEVGKAYEIKNRLTLRERKVLQEKKKAV